VTRLIVVLVFATSTALVAGQIVRPPLKAGEISDELMAEAIEEGLAGHGDFGSAACFTTRAGGPRLWRVVFRGPASRIAETAARAVAARQATGTIPAQMMSAPEITVEISLLPGGETAARGGPMQMTIAGRGAGGDPRSEVAPSTFQWAADARDRQVGSASFRRADLPAAFDVLLRGAAGTGAPWSCSMTRNQVAKIQ
jgi:hypothetical protein